MTNGLNIGSPFATDPQTTIVKAPGQNSIYYVFTQGFAHCIVDLSLSGGMGAVTAITSPTILVIPLYAYTGIGVTPHCNGQDLWVVSGAQTTLMALPLTAAGLIMAPITTTLNSGINSSISGKFSQNGKYYTRYVGNGNLVLFEFNAANGTFNNPLPLGLNIAGINCEFSPDGTKLYASDPWINGGQIHQWDLCAGSPTAIVNSHTVIPAPGMYALQLAPNGKIYATGFSQNFLGVINNPNLAGAACNYVNNGQSIAPMLSYRFLPNFSAGKMKTPPPPFTYTNNSAVSCNLYSFSMQNYSTCAASNYSVAGQTWSFGDPGSGAANSSTLANPSHAFSSGGTFTVQLVLNYSCGSDTLRQPIVVPGPSLAIATTSINCANLGSATLSLAGGTGPHTFTWLPSGQTASVATNLPPGNHTLVVHDSGINCTFTSTSYFSPLIPLTGTISTSFSISFNSAFTGTGQVLNLSGGSGNQTYQWLSGNQTFTTASTNSLTAGIGSIIVTDALTGCQMNQTFFLSQPPPLVPLLSSSTTSFCSGGSAVLSATNSGGTPPYNYTFVNGPASFSAVVTESLSGVHVYSVLSSDANNCLSMATLSIDVIPHPMLVAGNLSVCPNTSAIFTLTGATSYTWLPAVTANSTTTNAASILTPITFSDNPLTNTQYTLIGAHLSCLSSTSTSVFIYPSPLPIINSNSPRCEASTALISVTGGTAALWSGPNLFLSSTLSNTLLSPTPANTGLYSTTITSAVGCTASASSSFVVNATPTLSASGSTVCTTQTLTLTGGSVAGSLFNWSGPNGFLSAAQNPTLTSPSLNQSGSYTLLVTAPTSCTNTAIAQVSVTSPPSLALSLSSPSLCSQAFNGSPNTITLSSSGAATYTLFTPNLIGSSTPAGSLTSLASAAPFSASVGVGTATMIGSNGVCENSSTFSFSVMPNPTVGINSYTPVICAGQHFTYTANGANSFTWSSSTPNYTTYTSGSIAVTQPGTNAVFSVVGSSLGCQSPLVTSSITVYPLPVFTLSAASKSICLNEKTSLSANGTGQSYQWLPIGFTSSNAASFFVSPPATQVYTVIAAANNCTTSATLLLNVLPLPLPLITTKTETICMNDTIRLEAAGGQIYNWTGPANFFMHGQRIAFAARNGAFSGTYKLSVEDDNACKNSTQTTVHVLPLPNGSLLNFKEEACAPLCRSYQFQPLLNSKVESFWQINDTKYQGNTFYACLTEPGAYVFQAQLQDLTSSCKADLTYVLELHEKPKADFNFAPLQPLSGLDEVVFSNTTSGKDLNSFQWHFNDNTGFTTKTKNTSYLYQKEGLYPVVLIAETKFGCADTVIKTIRVAEEFNVYIPNSFTPNGDGRNDQFFPVLSEHKLYNLEIYDRWGARVFFANSVNDTWDGTFKNEDCKQDVYTWTLDLTTLHGKRYTKTGSVMLLR